MNPGPSRLTTWCRLLRLPNLFTVPGDPLAGFMLATGGMLDWRVAGAMATSLLLYSAGLLLNDYFDRETDARERPERPIPSGAIRAQTVLAAGSLLLIGGPFVAYATSGPVAGFVAGVVALAVFSYNAALKRVPGLGILAMGACRGGSVAIGAAAAPNGVFFGSDVEAGVLLTLAYVTFVSIVALNETDTRYRSLSALFPPFAPALAALRMVMEPVLEGIAFLRVGLGFHFRVSWAHAAAAGVIVGVIVRAVQLSLRVWRRAAPVPPLIGSLLRALIPFQAAWCLWSQRGAAQLSLALATIACFLLLGVGAKLSSRRFYGS